MSGPANDSNFDIGARLLAMRQAAEPASIPHAQISIIEQNKSSPSISCMRNLLSAPNVTMADFLDSDRRAPEGPFFTESDLLALTGSLHASGAAEPTGRWCFGGSAMREATTFRCSMTSM